MTNFGLISSIWRSRYLEQAAISGGCGSRLSGGRHLTIFAMKTSSRLVPMDASNPSSSCPAGPTNGRPWRSSWNPGPSPINSRSALGLPSPGTAFVLPRWSGQSVQARTSRATSSRLSMALLPQLYARRVARKDNGMQVNATRKSPDGAGV